MVLSRIQTALVLAALSVGAVACDSNDDAATDDTDVTDTDAVDTDDTDDTDDAA